MKSFTFFIMVAFAGLLLAQSMQIRDLQHEVLFLEGYANHVNDNWRTVAEPNMPEKIETSTMENIGLGVAILAFFAGLVSIGTDILSVRKRKKEQELIIKQKIVSEIAKKATEQKIPTIEEQWETYNKQLKEYEEWKKNNPQEETQ